jgi:hypothetical protein
MVVFELSIAHFPSIAIGKALYFLGCGTAVYSSLCFGHRSFPSFPIPVAGRAFITLLYSYFSRDGHFRSSVYPFVF